MYRIIIILLFIFSSPQNVAAELTSLIYADHLKILGFMDSGVLKVHISLKNREKDQLVNWINPSIECECDVYENIGDFFNPVKGNKIGSKKQFLKKNMEDIYINLKNIHYYKGVVSCSVDTGYNKLTAYNTFYIKNIPSDNNRGYELNDSSPSMPESRESRPVRVYPKGTLEMTIPEKNNDKYNDFEITDPKTGQIYLKKGDYYFNTTTQKYVHKDQIDF